MGNQLSRSTTRSLFRLVLQPKYVSHSRQRTHHILVYLYVVTLLNAILSQFSIASVKTRIKDAIVEEAQQWLGCGMTYTLFECLKDRTEELMVDQPNKIEAGLANIVETVDKCAISGAGGKQPKKEQLTKAQKRRQWEHSDHKGDKPRGWNWVDIVKHLSQTGGKEEGGALPSNYDG